MERTEELQAEIDALRGRLAACENAMCVIADGLGSMLEACSIVTRQSLGENILFNVRSRRIKGDGSSVELDLIEAAGKRLLEPSAASVSLGTVN